MLEISAKIVAQIRNLMFENAGLNFKIEWSKIMVQNSKVTKVY